MRLTKEQRAAFSKLGRKSARARKERMTAEELKLHYGDLARKRWGVRAS